MRYHYLEERGLGICTATVRACPLSSQGAIHFESPEEMLRFFTEKAIADEMVAFEAEHYNA